jgi:hypothetical protein
MKVERYLCVNEKLIIVKVKGVINEWKWIKSF